MRYFYFFIFLIFIACKKIDFRENLVGKFQCANGRDVYIDYSKESTDNQIYFNDEIRYLNNDLWFDNIGSGTFSGLFRGDSLYLYSSAGNNICVKIK